MPRAGLPAHALRALLKVHGAKARKVGQSELHIVDLPPGLSEKAVVNVLARNPHLKFAELDYRVAPSFATNDPYAGSQWHLANIGVPAAWDTTLGTGVTIAILDSGVDATHADLAAALVPGWNFYDNNSDTRDVYGHGTKVAGAAAAVANNGAGVAGVAGGARLMPIRVTDTSGLAYTSTVAQGLTYAADRGARVANASFAMYDRFSVKSAAQYMKDKNGLVMMSAGNTGTQNTAAATTSLITVAATNSANARASWSSYGPAVALAAPGVSIYTTTRGGGYAAVDGTSFASPVTAATAALLMSARPELSSTQVEDLLYRTAIDLGAAGRDPYYGYGRIDAAAAMRAALSVTPAPDTQPPVAGITNLAGGSVVSGLVPIDVAASDNVGVARVELQVNGTTVAIDSTAPYGFSWDSSGVPNGSASVTAVAFDAAGNRGTSSAVVVSVSNALVSAMADSTAPTLSIVTPVPGPVAGTVSVSTNASDNGGAAGIEQSIYVDNVLKASGKGSTLSFSWNARKVAAGTHVIEARARDAAGNTASTTTLVTTN
ncbi:S8 family serine peptidase [Azohydromonas sp. G-1-1-14]|uniref:S8 family serine peptidase n=2 Tax=Azohydromonas caseinilytica TaxID=2728836 RepID=A0A848FFW3_9BURK|nr:S8 family serine peptidase [Azohydromonas caseinilytica]